MGACPDVDRLYLKDPGGLVDVDAPARARAAVPRRLRPAAGRAAQPRHDRARAADVHGGRAARVRHAPHRGRAGRERHLEPGRRDHAPQPRGDRARPRARRRGAGARCPRTSARSRSTSACRSVRRPSSTPRYYRHQMPGGMVTTMRRQLAEMRRPELFEAALEECGRVRAEFGWPIMVTPFSQFVGTQAVMNVMDGERYRTIPDDVIVYFLGHFGGAARAARPRRRRPRPVLLARGGAAGGRAALARRRARALRHADLRRGAAAAPDDARRAGRRDGRDLARRAPGAGRPRPGRDPLVRLLDEVARRPSIGYLRFEKDDTLVEYRRSPGEASRAPR